MTSASTSSRLRPTRARAYVPTGLRSLTYSTDSTTEQDDQDWHAGKPRGLAPLSTLPDITEREYVHPYHDCKERAAELEAEQQKAREQLEARHEILGDDCDDPGALSTYEKHRRVEFMLAGYFRNVVAPYARSVHDYEAADDLELTALKLLDCRQSGPFGLCEDGRVIVQWEQKCSCSKYCPSEAAHESKRLRQRYEQAIIDHTKTGGRVYKAWLTLPNYPVGRLAEGQKHIFKRMRAKLVRARLRGVNPFGIEGALVILEAPLSANDDWNVHLNVILLTRGWLDYGALREQWGFNLEIEQHKFFDDQGMHALFVEMVKYSTRAIPEKSADEKHKTRAPAMTEWSGLQTLEWHKANKGFRRTRAFGSLHGIGKPDLVPLLPTRWIGRIEYRAGGYSVLWRPHDLADNVNRMLRDGVRDLDLIRGDKSTRARATKPHHDPP